MNETLFMLGSFISVAVFFVVFFILLALKFYHVAGIVFGVFFLSACLFAYFFDRQKTEVTPETSSSVEIHVIDQNDISIVSSESKTFRGETKGGETKGGVF
tara:strand:+ start:193 stop:495 length:303 start_codon:yes stop_codon:yes gene_type:complete